jgi:hypothetical protein
MPSCWPKRDWSGSATCRKHSRRRWPGTGARHARPVRDASEEVVFPRRRAREPSAWKSAPADEPQPRFRGIHRPRGHLAANHRRARVPAPARRGCHTPVGVFSTIENGGFPSQSAGFSRGGRTAAGPAKPRGPDPLAVARSLFHIPLMIIRNLLSRRRRPRRPRPCHPARQGMHRTADVLVYDALSIPNSCLDQGRLREDPRRQARQGPHHAAGPDQRAHRRENQGRKIRGPAQGRRSDDLRPRRRGGRGTRRGGRPFRDRPGISSPSPGRPTRAFRSPTAITTRSSPFSPATRTRPRVTVPSITPNSPRRPAPRFS